MKTFNSIENLIVAFKEKKVATGEQVSVNGYVCQKLVGKVPQMPYVAAEIVDGNYALFCLLDSTHEHFKKLTPDKAIGLYNKAATNLKLEKNVSIKGYLSTPDNGKTLNIKIEDVDIK